MIPAGLSRPSRCILGAALIALIAVYWPMFLAAGPVLALIAAAGLALDRALG